MALRRRLFAVLSLSVSACRDPAAPYDPTKPIEVIAPPTRDVGALFQTDSLSYTLTDLGDGYAGILGVRFTNLSGRTVYFVNCLGGTSLQLEKLDGNQWRVAWNPVLLKCLSPPITVSPGGTHDSQIFVFGAHPNTNTFPVFFVSYIPGIYRVVWNDALSTYQDQPPFGAQLPFEQRLSNRFALTVTHRQRASSR